MFQETKEHEKPGLSQARAFYTLKNISLIYREIRD